MSTPTLIRSFVVGTGGVAQNKIVKFGGADGEVVLSAAAADAHLGVCIQPGATAAGARADVVVDGIVEVIAGGTIVRGGLVTADSAGDAIAATASAGANIRVLGVAMVSAADNDIFPVLLKQGTFQGA